MLNLKNWLGLFVVVFSLLIFISNSFAYANTTNNATAQTDLVDSKSAENKQFVLVVGEFPPYTIRPEDIQGSEVRGLNIDIILAAFHAVDYQVSVEVMPFARAFRYAQSGKADGTILWHNLERERWFTFSASLSRSNMVFYKRKTLDFSFGDIESLLPYSLGVVTDYAYSPEFLHFAGLDKQTVGTDEQNIHKLVAGRIDLALVDERVGAFLMKHHYPIQKEDYDIAGILQFEDFYLAMSKKSDQYHQKMIDFNNGLARIRKNGALQRIVEQYK